MGTAAIIKHGRDADGDMVTGTATAASIWMTGAIGAAVAYSFYEIAIVVMGMAFLTLHYMTRFKQ